MRISGDVSQVPEDDHLSCKQVLYPVCVGCMLDAVNNKMEIDCTAYSGTFCYMFSRDFVFYFVLLPSFCQAFVFYG